MGFFSKNKDEDIGFIINTDDTVKISGNKNIAPHAITADEVSELLMLNYEEQQYPKTGALDSLKKRMNVSDTPEKNDQKENKDVDTKTQMVEVTDNFAKKSLLEKLQPYTIDEQGHDLSQTKEPLYRLESVAEILKKEGQKTIENLSKKYDIFVDDLGKTQINKEKQLEEQQDKLESQQTSTFKEMVNESEKHKEKQLYNSLFETENKLPQPIVDIPDISDIDTHEYGLESKKNTADTATIRFTPIKDHKGNTDHITISSITKHIDLGEMVPTNESAVNTTLEKSDFEKFEPKTEVTDITTGKKILRKLAIEKRSSFLSLIVSVITVSLLLVFLIQPVFNFIIKNPKSAMFFCGCVLLVSALANFTMIFEFKKLLKNKFSADVFASIATLFTLSLSLYSAITSSNADDAYYIILLCSIILLFRSIANFKLISAKHSNLKQILHDGQKNAVTLISDTATTFAMAKNTIDGDVLVCSHKKTDFIEDYLKHWEFSITEIGKHSVVFYITVALAILSATAANFYYDLFSAFYCAATISCIAAIPTLFLVDAFPLSSATKKLNKNGAMIAGLHGAEKIENANAAVVSIKDIFPEGTVSMYSMKVLSDNNIDETILKAASLTAAVGSPLESIFKHIAGTNSSYSIPDSDTVKYEKRLGISGWVDNELLFIGNRSLMEAHGIQIPSVEIDKKILRRGYFPVYVATENTACALIVIQYDVRRDIAKELRITTELGVTLLIDNCDPNINEEMICDYFGLYKDSVKIMTNAGVYMHKNATPPTKSFSAPAAFRGSALNFITLINCSSNIKKSNLILTVLYSIFAILGISYFIYVSFSGSLSIPTSTTVLAYELLATVLSIIGFLIRKP